MQLTRARCVVSLSAGQHNNKKKLSERLDRDRWIDTSGRRKFFSTTDAKTIKKEGNFHKRTRAMERRKTSLTWATRQKRRADEKKKKKLAADGWSEQADGYVYVLVPARYLVGEKHTLGLSCWAKKGEKKRKRKVVWGGPNAYPISVQLRGEREREREKKIEVTKTQCRWWHKVRSRTSGTLIRCFGIPFVPSVPANPWPPSLCDVSQITKPTC